MSLAGVLVPVNTILTTNGALSTTTGTPALEIASTPKRDRTATPRVTWVPTQDSFNLQPPAMTRSVQQAFLAANPGKQIPRAIATRQVGVEAHIWAGNNPGSADDYSLTEALVGAVISALRHQAYGVVHLLGGAWVNPGVEANKLGHRYVLNLAIDIPVLEVQDNAPQPPVGESVVTTAETQTDTMGPLSPGGGTYSSTP